VEYRLDYAEIKAPAGEEVAPYTRMLRIESPPWTPAPPDTTLAFEATPIAGTADARWNWAGAVQLASTGAPVLAVANGDTVQLASNVALAFPGSDAQTPPSAEGVLPIDFNYDFRTDLVLAGAGGVRLYRQDEAARFSDITE